MTSLILFSLLALLIVLIAFAFIIKGLFQTIALKALKENQKSFLELAEQSFKQLRISSNEDLDSKKSAIEKQLVQLNQELNALKESTTELKTNLNLSKETLNTLTRTTTAVSYTHLTLPTKRIV